MKRIILTAVALFVASTFGLVQFGSGTAFVTPAAAPQRQVQQQPGQSGQSAYPQTMGRQSRHMQYFIGIIQKRQGKFVLVAGTQTYKLKGQTQAANYDNKQVEIEGKLASNGKAIRVYKISPLKSQA